ncbi:4Fe-4S dicluster domain-containing protein [Blastopirellula sp. JC732]|uniref:4Fe-4S dicluster domain-containing protein n=1 Tax=Blastopirellula sediminis TaxID=2894196 RepID=A0A9X1MM60_9BACT|nr:4Fe-4S dicluster domain-containing protein [Blastopirellula sediminis]MCC9608346.1 4Fe-4S dicluster domain-containing protein [Blastopirellula sediminis]MCC9628877.1 4Fe-4S dicluster domain-containing protein [Blastopirellula sediminis]
MNPKPQHNSAPQLGQMVRIAKEELGAIVQELRERGYRTILPKVADGAVIYDEAEDASALPIGVIDEQDAARYRLRESGQSGYFDYVVGPHAVKQYLFPPVETLLRADRVDGAWSFETPKPECEPTAIIGVRACDLHAIAIQDRVFLEGAYVDEGYRARREKLVLIAVNCRRAAITCFCHSMGTGPAVKRGFDLSLTELEEEFAVEVGSSLGSEVMAACRWSPCTDSETGEVRAIPERLERKMVEGGRGFVDGEDEAGNARELDIRGIRDLLVNNLDHKHWDAVAERCLSCANCTMVCPTCFCASVDEVSDLTGDHVSRERTWGSCFNAEHSYMNSGVVRHTIRSRYRQWLVHKLATWIDQFDTSGCVGCGRCITWCPVGIDLTEEVAAIRETQT